MRPLSWLDSKIIPRGCAAVLSALQFQPGAGEALRTLDDADWPGALNFADNARLTLLLGHNCQQHLPPAIAARISSNLEANRRRIERLSIDYLQIADHLASAGVEHVLLKGFLHAPRFVPDASLRQQAAAVRYRPAVSAARRPPGARAREGAGLRAGLRPGPLPD